ncbi:MAG: hypothetical protein HY961_20150 [Ignavibacteriae bacterium]|nr:hypothetical protein [Ignavibacteriota bacterium]
MKLRIHIAAFVSAAGLLMTTTQTSLAQGYDSPLTYQGLNHASLQSAASRASGGISLAIRNDVSIMFSNPAQLTSLQGLQFSFGGVQQFKENKQEQRYGGLQTHSAFSLLMEGTTGSVSDPDTVYNPPPTASDTVQRPFDSIGPNWGRKKNKTLPLQAFVAVPFSLESMRIVAGAGFVQYANLERFYQNNNCLSPSVLSVLDSTIRTGNLNANPYRTQWYQYYQQREGAIYGYGGAVSVALFNERLSLGVSGLYLKGSTDDNEARIGRGRLAFYNNYLRIDKYGMVNYTKTGTSDYSGAEITLSGRYKGKNFTAGFSVKPPTTITRKFSMSIQSDTVTGVYRANHRADSSHATYTGSVSGEDKTKFPWRGNIGLAINLRDNLVVGVEYEIRSYASAEYTDANGIVTNPWLSFAGWRVGAEFRPSDWLALRAGVREDAELFEPLSNALRGEPQRYAVVSFGAGVNFAGAKLNVAYEFSNLKYIDTWSNAASINTESVNTIIADVSYEIPW